MNLRLNEWMNNESRKNGCTELPLICFPVLIKVRSGNNGTWKQENKYLNKNMINTLHCFLPSDFLLSDFCSLFSVLCSDPCFLFSDLVHCTMFSYLSFLFSVSCSLFSFPSACSVLVPCSLFFVPWTLFSVPWTLFSVLYSLFPVPSSSFSSLSVCLLERILKKFPRYI